MTAQPNRSSLPIDIDTDMGEETIQKEEEKHTNAEEVDLGFSEKTTIREKKTASDPTLPSKDEEDEATPIVTWLPAIRLPLLRKFIQDCTDSYSIL